MEHLEKLSLRKWDSCYADIQLTKSSQTQDNGVSVDKK